MRTLRIGPWGPSHPVGWLVLLAVLLTFPGLGARDLWNPDEARYAEVAREMAVQGQVFVPQLNGEIYAEKPPLFFWAIELAGLLTGGIDETAARLPSALAALGTMLLVFFLARRLFNQRAAWLAALAFATCFKVLWQSRFGQIDLLLTFWVTLAMWWWFHGWLENRPRLSLLFFLVAGVATITKGPVGLLPPLLSIAAFLLVSGRWRELGRLHLGRGLLIWAAVVLAWLIPAGLIAGWGYVEHMIFRQNVTRFIDPWHHYQPFHYYFAVLPVEFLPWSLFFPAALRLLPRQLCRPGAPANTEPSGTEPGGTEPSSTEPGTGPGTRSREPLRRDGLLFSLCWIVVTLLFFSLSPAKRSVYILPLYPAMALWIGATLDRLADLWPRYRSWVLLPVGGFALAVGATTVSLPFVGARRAEIAILGQDFLWSTVVAVGLLFLATVLCLVLARRHRPVEGAATLALGVSAFWLAVALSLLPALDAFKSARGLAGELVEHAAPEEPWTVFPHLDAGFLYYSGRYADRLAGEGSAPQEIASLEAFVARPERVWVVARRDRLAQVDGLPPLYEVARDADEAKGYLLLTNRPLSDFSPETQLEK